MRKRERGKNTELPKNQQSNAQLKYVKRRCRLNIGDYHDRLKHDGNWFLSSLTHINTCKKKGFAFSPLAIWHRFPGNTTCCPIIPLKLHSSSKFIQEIPQRMLRFMWTRNFMNIECVTFFECWNIQRVYTKYNDRMHVNMMFWPENYSILFLSIKMLRD